jgi:hypothetical protein
VSLAFADNGALASADNGGNKALASGENKALASSGNKALAYGANGGNRKKGVPQRVTAKKKNQSGKGRYPAITEPKFYDAELPKDHKAFNWNDFHFTEGMEYKPPPVLEHNEVPLPDASKRHERDLISIQGYWAQTTRFYDTCAHEIVDSGESDTAIGKRMLNFLNTVRISAAHDAARISRMRENIYFDELGIKHGTDREDALITLEQLAAKKTATEQVRTTYKKYEPPKDKSKKPDNKSSKGKAVSGEKPKTQQSSKSQTKDKSRDKTGKGKSGYKSDSGKSGGKPRNKSGGGQGKKQPDQGNDDEESD